MDRRGLRIILCLASVAISTLTGNVSQAQPILVAAMSETSPICQSREPHAGSASDCVNGRLYEFGESEYCIQYQEFICCMNAEHCPSEIIAGGTGNVCEGQDFSGVGFLPVACESDMDCARMMIGDLARCVAGQCQHPVRACRRNDQTLCLEDATDAAAAHETIRQCVQSPESNAYVAFSEGDCDGDGVSNQRDRAHCAVNTVFYVDPNIEDSRYARPCTNNTECEAGLECTSADDARTTPDRHCMPPDAARFCQTQMHCQHPLDTCHFTDVASAEGYCINPDQCGDHVEACHTSPEDADTTVRFESGDCDGDGIENAEDSEFCPSSPSMPSMTDNRPRFVGGGVTCALGRRSRVPGRLPTALVLALLWYGHRRRHKT